MYRYNKLRKVCSRVAGRVEGKKRSLEVYIGIYMDGWTKSDG